MKISSNKLWKRPIGPKAMFIQWVLVGIFLSLMGCDGPNELVSANKLTTESENYFDLKVKINNGASITAESVVSIQITASSSATELYVTQNSSCNQDGSWESIRPFKVWELSNLNDINFFYVKVRNSKNESKCVFADIKHDSIPPELQVLSPTNGSLLLNSIMVTVSGTCDEDSKIGFTINAVSIFTNCEAGLWGVDLDISSLPSGPFMIQIKAQDSLQNMSEVKTLNLIKP